MIRRLTGTVLEKTEHSIVIAVGGLGYLVACPSTQPYQRDQTISLYTHLAVRENALDLYAFSTEAELELFEQLLTLPKIGPKSALQILSQASLTLIQTAVKNQDAGQLSKLSGLGKKTAEKVVIGLTDIYEKQGVILVDDTAPDSMAGDSVISDTIDALITLGYPEHDARKTVQQLIEADATLENTNDILKAALRSLGS